jgi:hypothetical protein
VPNGNKEKDQAQGDEEEEEKEKRVGSEERMSQLLLKSCVRNSKELWPHRQTIILKKTSNAISYTGYGCNCRTLSAFSFQTFLNFSITAVHKQTYTP